MRALDFEDYEARMLRLLKTHGGGPTPAPGPAPAAVRCALDAYFVGDLEAIDNIPVATGGTPFQRTVWAALRRIPAGTTTSYGALAAIINHPSAMRAVGLAVSSNPVAMIRRQPCVEQLAHLDGLAVEREPPRCFLARFREWVSPDPLSSLTG